MSNFINEILQSRGLEQCPVPFWKLKMTDSEYHQLCETLQKRVITRAFYLSNPFNVVCEETALFVAEFWRRECSEEVPSIEDIYAGLQLPKGYKYAEQLFQSACEGAQLLGVDYFEDQDWDDIDRTEALNALIFQGGLPMKLITDEQTKTLWSKVSRRIVNRSFNVNHLDLELSEGDKASVKAFCDDLQLALDSNQPERLPYHAEAGEKDERFLYLHHLAQREKNKRSLLRPFTVSWQFQVEEEKEAAAEETVAADSGKNLQASYCVEGAYRLPETFIEEFGLEKFPHFTLQICRNGQTDRTFDYVRWSSTHTVHCTHAYHPGDHLALLFSEVNTPFLTDELNLSVPYLLYESDPQTFTLGNQLGQAASLVLAPEGWNLEHSESWAQETYCWEGRVLTGWHIPADYSQEVCLKKGDESVSFRPHTPIYWTEVQARPMVLPGVDQPLYDLSNCEYALCSDEDAGARTATLAQVEFKNQADENWTDTPSYGCVMVRAKDPRAAWVAPARLIHIGGGLTVEVVDADATSCTLHVCWEHGTVSTEEGALKADNVWLVLQEDLTNDRIHFTLTPHEESRNAFTLTLKAPFKGFRILDEEGRAVASRALIPYVEADKYRYELVGQSLRSYTLGKRRRELRWVDDVLYLYENKEQIRPIPYTGCLTELFDSREALQQLLEQTSPNRHMAEIRVTFNTPADEKWSLIIKDEPYRIRQEEDQLIVFTDSKKTLDYRQPLKLLRLDDPHTPALLLPYDERRGYVLPEAIRSWGPALAMGASGGSLRPTLVALGGALSSEGWTIRQNRMMEELAEALAASSFGDELWTRILAWYHRIQEEEIPVNSLLHMCGVAQQPDALICLAFQLYAQCETEAEREELTEQMKAFSQTMGFGWYWLQPQLNMLMLIIHQHLGDMNSDFMKACYTSWAVQKGAEGLKYTEALNDEEAYGEYFGECMFQMMEAFSSWMQRLCFVSLTGRPSEEMNEITHSLAEAILETPDQLNRLEDLSEEYVDYKQDTTDKETKAFFATYGESLHSSSSSWLAARANAVSAHLQGQVSLFAQPEGVRHSILFCNQSYPSDFILALNNRLADK